MISQVHILCTVFQQKQLTKRKLVKLLTACDLYRPTIWLLNSIIHRIRLIYSRINEIVIE